jgi:hypothetical protein
MFVKLNEKNQVVEIVPYDDISDKFHPDVQALFYPIEGEVQLNDYVELQPRSEMQEVITTEIVQVPVVDEEGNPVLDEQGEPTFTQEERQVVEQVEVELKPLAVKIDPPADPPLSPEEQQEQLRSMVRAAIAFGNNLIEEFIMENIVLGITQDGMSATVLNVMAPASEALRFGSLYVAIERLKAIPAESKDAKYVTDARLLQAVNKIEQYLNVPLSETL